MNDETRAALEDMIRSYVTFGAEETLPKLLDDIDRLLADRAATVAEPDAETVERVGKAMYASLGDIRRDMWDDDSEPYPYEEFIQSPGGRITNEDYWDFTSFTFAQMRDAAIAAMPQGDPDWQVELRSLYFHHRQEVYREMQWNDRYAVRGDLRVMWPDALLGIEGTEVLAAIAKAKEGAG